MIKALAAFGAAVLLVILFFLKYFILALILAYLVLHIGSLEKKDDPPKEQ